MQIVTIDLIPQKEKPIVKLSQYDNDRQVRFMLKENGEPYTLAGTETVEVNIRKPDRNIVVIAPTIGANVYVDVLFTEQSTACFGESFGKITIKSGETVIGTCNFIIEVEISPIYGGINSTTEINNLETQIEEIITEVLSDDYYTKTETDDLLSAKADASDVYTKTQTDTLLSAKANASEVYTKTETDDLLSAKANASEVYTKTETDDLLSAKANASEVYTKTETDDLLSAKANASEVYTKTEVDNIILDIMPVGTASGPIATFNTELAAPLVNVSSNIVATGGNGTPDSPIPINGYTEANITANGNVITVPFGQTVYGGVLDVTRGKLRVTHGYKALSELTWYYNASKKIFYSQSLQSELKAVAGADVYNFLCDEYNAVSVNTLYNTEPDNSIAIGYIYSDKNVNVIDNNYTDATTFKNNVTGHIAYEIATPIDIDLTPEVISAVVGTNNVHSDTNGDTTVRFKDSIQHYIDNH